MESMAKKVSVTDADKETVLNHLLTKYPGVWVATNASYFGLPKPDTTKAQIVAVLRALRDEGKVEMKRSHGNMWRALG